MRRRRLAHVAVALVGWLAPVAGADPMPPQPDRLTGRAAYDQHCARCHGVTGRGDGVDAARFYPRPRDLTLGVYKFRSTASGTPPTDEDLFRTISQGLPGTNMPDWPHLDEATRWQLVSYLKSLSSFFEEVEPEPVALSEDPGPRQADVAKGRQVYEQLGCAACHGQAGRGNGPSAAGLVDDWGMPIRPANLTQGWNYRGGRDPRSVTLRFVTGIDGSGMPSYAEVISPQDAWHLAYYVTSLQEPAHEHLIARAVRVEGELPAGLDDPRWAQAERTDVRLRHVVTTAGEWADPPTIIAVGVQVLLNEQELAVRFTWDDPTRDAADRLALALKPAGSQGDVISLQAWPSAGAPALDLCSWSADAPSAAEAVAVGFDPVRDRRDPQVRLASAAAYEDGRWQLLLRRPLAPTEPAGAAVIAPDGVTAIAIAVWDGSQPDARAVSPWVDLLLRQPLLSAAH
jgi:cytochrome c oxidase cbb3-type subunit 2